MISAQSIQAVYDLIENNFIEKLRATSATELQIKTKLSGRELRWVLKTLENDNRIKRADTFQNFLPNSLNRDIYFKGKKVGRIEGNTYITDRSSLHLMLLFGKRGSFGISEELLERLEKMGINEVIINYKDYWGKRKYKTKLKDFINSNLRWDNKGDWQRFLKVGQFEMF